MPSSIPVAGALDPASVGADLLVVEASPESEATRACKGIARHVFRFAQEVRWAGSKRAVAVRILGPQRDAALIATNLALLLAPLLDIGLEASEAATDAFAPEIGGDEHVSPRDRLWLVPPDDLAEAADRYEMTIGSAEGAGLGGADLVLVPAHPGTDRVDLPDVVDAFVEFAVVFVGDVDDDLPDEVAIA